MERKREITLIKACNTNEARTFTSFWSRTGAGASAPIIAMKDDSYKKDISHIKIEKGDSFILVTCCCDCLNDEESLFLRFHILAVSIRANCKPHKLEYSTIALLLNLHY